MVKKAKTILPIGNKEIISILDINNEISPCNNFLGKKRVWKAYFTLVELIVAVVILVTGILFIYESFFTSLNVSSYAQHYIYAQLWMDNKIESIENDLKRYKAPLFPQTRGYFDVYNKKFLWDLSYSFSEGTDKIDMYRITLKVKWRESKRNIELVRATYIYFKKE